MNLRNYFELIRMQLGREEGQTMAEYGILVGVIALVAIAGAILLGSQLNTLFGDLANQL